MKPHESTQQPGLWFWAEKDSGPVPCWIVYSQASGFPGTEACDDWFYKFEDADQVARLLAEGKL